MTKSDEFCLLILGFIILIIAIAGNGCQSETGLRTLPTPYIEVVEGEDPANPDEDNGYILTHIDPPAMVEDDEEQQEEEETSAPGPDGVECPERVLYDTHYFGQGEVEVAGYPVITTSSPAAVEIIPGEPVVVVFTITAMCGPIRWQGGDLYMAPSGEFGAWNEPFYGHNQAPMPLEDVGLAETMEIQSYCVSYAPEGQLFWPARETYYLNDNIFVGRDLDEGESVTYRFTFTGTSIVPVGETLLVGLTSGVWSDTTTGTEILFDGNFYSPATVTVVE